MLTTAKIPNQTTTQTRAAPAQEAFQSRPFVEQPLQPEYDGPDIETQLATAQQFGHHFGNISVFPPAQPVIQREAGDRAAADVGEAEGQANQTGLPGKLKAGLEGLSGMPMDDVKVHYNSPEPAQFQALAHTQGTDIHLGPGQEQHLPHEAWHVVQQKQGRVQPTMQLKATYINDNSALEHEADTMGAKAAQGGPRVQPENFAQRAFASHVPNAGLRQQSVASNAPIQFIGFESEEFEPELEGKLKVHTVGDKADIRGKEINVFNGSVKVTDAEDEEAQEWEAGIIQTVYDSYVTDTYKHDDGTYWRKTLHIEGGTRDGVADAPWYNIHHEAFAGNDDSRYTIMTDNPGGTPKLEIADKGKLVESTRYDNFVMWQVACKTDHNNNDDNVVFLKHLPWQFGYRVTYNPENQDDHRVIGGITKGDVVDGKGNHDPNLWDTPITLSEERIAQNTNWEEVKQESDQKYTDEINTIQQAEQKAGQKQDVNQQDNEPQNQSESEVKDESPTNEPQNQSESEVKDESPTNEPQNQSESDIDDETKGDPQVNVLLDQANYFQNGQELAENQIEWFYQQWTGELEVLVEQYALSPQQTQQLVDHYYFSNFSRINLMNLSSQGNLNATRVLREKYRMGI